MWDMVWIALVALGPELARADGAGVAEFLGPRGCVIGPGTAEAALAIGIGSGDLKDFAARAAALPGSVVTGPWLVVARDLCRISFPAIKSELSLEDAEVRANLSAMDAFADQGQPGCFLNGDGLRRGLQVSRGWDEERAWTAYLALVGAGLQSGELAFHLDDALRAPIGPVLTTGTCGQAAGMAVIRADHATLMANLDGVIRLSLDNLACEEGAALLTLDAQAVGAMATGGGYRNEWGWMEVLMMAMALGWYEGASLTRKGMPRPPLCHLPGE